MTNENDRAAAREIPVPPAGGSWAWNGTEWVSNNPAPVAEPADQAINNNFEQEQ